MTDWAASSRVVEVAQPSDGASYGPGHAAAPLDFTTIFENEFDHVCNTLRRLGVAPRDLEDLTHDVFLDVYRKLDEYDPSRPLRPWLFAFGFRVASDYRRRASHTRELIGEADRVDEDPLADEQLVSRDNRELVAAALDTLDLDRRAVFVLHDLDDCPVPEIAAALQIPLNTAYSRLRVAREQFAKAVARLRLREDTR
jgi:RNA polymerase sigma-70 factor (ECF subfamily)